MLRNYKYTKQLLTSLRSMRGPEISANFYPYDSRPNFFSFHLSYLRTREHPQNRDRNMNKFICFFNISFENSSVSNNAVIKEIPNVPCSTIQFNFPVHENKSKVGRWCFYLFMLCLSGCCSLTTFLLIPVLTAVFGLGSTLFSKEHQNACKICQRRKYFL